MSTKRRSGGRCRRSPAPAGIDRRRRADRRRHRPKSPRRAERRRGPTLPSISTPAGLAAEVVVAAGTSKLEDEDEDESPQAANRRQAEDATAERVWVLPRIMSGYPSAAPLLQSHSPVPLSSIQCSSRSACDRTIRGVAAFARRPGERHPFKARARPEFTFGTFCARIQRFARASRAASPRRRRSTATRRWKGEHRWQQQKLRQETRFAHGRPT